MPDNNNSLPKDLSLEELGNYLGESSPQSAREEYSSLNPSFVRGIDPSKYEGYNIQYGQNLDWEEQRARNQSGGEKFSRALANTATELTLGTLKGVTSIPDVFVNFGKMATGEVATFENDLSKYLRESIEGISESNAIHKSKYEDAFDLTSGSWWAANMPSLASAATFILPMMAVGRGTALATRGIGKAATKAGWLKNLSKERQLTQEGIEALGRIESGVGTVVGAFYSNAAESFQEAVPMALQMREKLLADGKSVQEADEISAKIGRDIYTKNLVNIALELPSSASLLKSFKRSRQMMNEKYIRELGTEIGTEGAQEIVNTISSKEALRNANISGEYLEDDGSSLTDRIVDDHLTNGETWTAAFFGGFGGAGFKAAQSGIEMVDHKLPFNNDEISTRQQKSARKIAQSIALEELGAKTDQEVLHDFAKDSGIFELSYMHSEAGTSEKYEERLQVIKNDPEALEQLGTTPEEIDNYIKKTKLAEESYNKSIDKLGVKNPANYSDVDVNKKYANAIYQLESAKDSHSNYVKEHQALQDEISKEGAVYKEERNNAYANLDFNEKALIRLNNEKASLEKKREKFKKGGKGTRQINRRTIDRFITIKENQIIAREDRIKDLKSTYDLVGGRAASYTSPKLEELDILSRKIEDTELRIEGAKEDLDKFGSQSAIEKYAASITESKNEEVETTKKEVEQASSPEELDKLSETKASVESKKIIQEKKDEFTESGITSTDEEELGLDAEELNAALSEEEDPMSIMFPEGDDIDVTLDNVEDEDINLDLEEPPSPPPPSGSFLTRGEEVKFNPNKSYYEIVGTDGTKYNINPTLKGVDVISSDNKVQTYEGAKFSENTITLSDGTKIKVAPTYKSTFQGEDTHEYINTIERFSSVLIIPKYGNVELVNEILQKPDWKNNVKFVASKRFANSYKDAKKGTVRERLFPSGEFLLPKEDLKSIKWVNNLSNAEQNNPTFTESKEYRRVKELEKEGRVSSEEVSKTDTTEWVKKIYTPTEVKNFVPPTLHNDSYKKGKKVYASNSTVVDIKLQVKDREGSWVDGGDVANPYQWLFANTIDEKGEYIDFSKMSYDEFKENFKFGSNRDKENARDFTIEEYQTFRQIFKENKDTFDFVNSLTEGKDVDITKYFTPKLSPKYTPLDISDRVPLDTYKVKSIIDTDQGVYIDRVTSDPLPFTKLPNRYIAEVELNNGVTAQLPVYTQELKDASSLIKKIKDSVYELASLPFDDPKSSPRADKIVADYEVFMLKSGVPSIKFVAKANRSSNNFYPAVEITYPNGKTKYKSIALIESKEDLNAIIKGLGIEVTNKFYNKGIKNSRRDVSPSELTTSSEVSGINMSVEFNLPTEKVNIPEVTEVSFVSDNYGDLSQDAILDKLTSLHESLRDAKGKDKAKIENEIEAAKKAHKNITKNNPNNDITAFKKPDGTEVTYGDIDFTRAKEWITNRLPDSIGVEKGDILFENMKSQGIIWGMFKDRIIHLSTNAAMGTEFHEAFHAVFRSFLTDEESLTILEEASNKYKYDQGEINKLRQIPAYSYKTNEELHSIYLEEKLADEFAEYIKTGQEPRSLFKQLYSYLKEFIDWLLNNSSDIDALFKNIDKGVFVNSSIVDNRFSTASTQPVFSIIPNTSPEKSESIVNTIAAEYIKVVQNTPSTVNITSEEFKEETLNNLLNRKVNIYNPSSSSLSGLNLKNLIKEQLIYEDDISRDVIKDEVLKTLSYYSFDYQEEAISDLEENESSERSWDVSFTEVGGFDTLSKEIKQFIALATYRTIDEFGIEIDKAIDFPSVYATLERNLSGVSPDKQLQRLEFLSKDNIQINAVYTKLKTVLPKETKAETSNGILDYSNDEMFVNRFYKAFEKESINYLQVLVEEGNEYKLIEANRKNIQHFQVNRWSRNYDELSTTMNASKIRNNLMTISNAITNEDQSDNLLPLVKDTFASFGIELSDGYIKHSFSLFRDDKGNKVTVFNDVPPLSIEDVRQLQVIIKKGENPFDAEVKTRTRLLKIAENDAKFREDLFTTNFQDANNKTRYSFVLPSHITVRHKEIVNNLLTDEGIASYKEDPYMRYNYFIEGNTNEDINNIGKVSKIAHVGDIRSIVDEDSEGATFKNIDRKSLILSMYGNYNKQITSKETGVTSAYFTPMIFESKSTSVAVELPIEKNIVKDNEISDRFIDKVYDTIFTQEFLRLNNKFNDDFKVKDWINLSFLKNDPDVDKALNIKREKGSITKIDKIVANDNLIKNKIREGLNNEILDHINVLLDEGIVKYKKDGIVNELLPKTSIDLYDYIAEYVLNDYVNSTAYTQLVQGDLARAKSSIDRVKRNGGEIAYGNSLGEGTYKVAYVKSSKEFINPDGTVNTEKKGRDVDTDDAQVYTTFNRWVDIHKRLGRLQESQKDILLKIENGEELTNEEVDNIDLISLKGVHYDGTYYHKMSLFPLTKQLTSEKVNGKWVALPGKEKLHNMREFMENNSIDELITESASKLKTDSTIDPKEFSTGSIQKYDGKEKSYKYSERENKYWRLQVENNSGKRKIVDGTQKLQLIDASLPEKYDDVRKEYYEALESVREQSFDFAESLLSDIKNGKKNIKYFLKSIKRTVENSNGDKATLEFLSELENDMKYDGNLPHINAKFEQLFLSHFKSGVLSQKVPGYKLTLVSSSGYEVLRSVTGKVVSVDEYKKDPAMYRSAVEEKELISSRLRLHRDSDGKIEYAEVAMPKLAARDFNLKHGDIISEDLLTMLGWRTPTQDYHSLIPFKVVEFLPEYYGDVAIAPSDITWLSGADYDVDSLYAQRKGFYVNSKGEDVIYGYGTTEKERFEEFFIWQRENNSAIKDWIKDQYYNNPTFKEKLNSLNEELSEVKKRRSEIYEARKAKTVSKQKLNIQDETLKNKKSSLEFKIKSLGVPQALKYFNLPSTLEEYKENPITSIGELHNTLLDLELEMSTVPELKKALFTPATMETLNSAVSIIYEKLRKLDEGSSLHNSINGKINSWQNNAVGKKNVGIIANQNLVSAFLTKMKVKLKEGITFDGELFEDYGIEKENDIIIKEKDGEFTVVHKDNIRRKQDSMSTMVSSATDNAKERHAAKLNFTDALLSELGVMISLGMGITRTSLFSSQPALREYSKLVADTRSAINPSPSKKSEILDSLISKYEATKDTLASRLENATSLPLTSVNMVESLKLENKKDLSIKEEYLNASTQLGALHLLKRLQEVSGSHTDVINVIKVNKGLGSSFENVDTIKESVENLRSSVFSNIGEAIEKNNNINGNIKLLNRADSISKNYFIDRTPFGIKAVKYVERSLNYSSLARKKEISKALTTYLGMKWFDKMFKDAGIELLNSVDLLYPSSQGETIVESYNKLSKEDEFKNNPLIKFLNPVLNSSTINEKGISQGFDSLEGDMRTKHSSKTTDKMMNGFEYLITNEKEEYRTFAKKLYRYLAVKDNLQFKNDSFIKFLSPKIFQQLANGYRILNYKLATENTSDAFSLLGVTEGKAQREFAELYLRHISNRNKLRKVSATYIRKNGKVLSSTKGSIKFELKTKPNSPLVIRVEYKGDSEFGGQPSYEYYVKSEYKVIDDKNDLTTYKQVSILNNYKHQPYLLSPKDIDTVNKLYAISQLENKVDERLEPLNTRTDYLEDAEQSLQALPDASETFKEPRESITVGGITFMNFEDSESDINLDDLNDIC